MGAFIGILGMLGFMVCLLLLLIKLIRRKPKKKTLLALVVFFVMFCAGIAMPTDSTSVESDSPNTSNKETVQETEQVSDSELQEEADIQEESNGDEETVDEAVDPALIKSFLETMLADSFDYSLVEGDETGFTISVAINGLTAEVYTAKTAGYDENYGPWVDAKNSMLEAYNATYELLITMGMENPSLMMIVLNDTNHDNYLLAMYAGSIVYDVMAD